MPEQQITLAWLAMATCEPYLSFKYRTKFMSFSWGKLLYNSLVRH